LLARLLAQAQGQAQAPAAADRWTFSVAPYLWLPSLEGTFNYGPPPPNGGTANVNVSESSILDALDFAFMINGEARKDRWLIATDFIYLDLSSVGSDVKSVDLNPGSGPINISTSTLNSGTQSSLKGTLWTLVGGYAAIQEPRGNLDLIGGFRYLGLDAKTDWQLTATVTGTGPAGNTVTFGRTGSVEKSASIWTAIVGAKGRVKLGESDWFVNYYADVGGGSDAFTWQGAGGIGWSYAKWGELLLDYRYLYYSQSGDKLIDSLTLKGFQLGFNFRF
jgi:hypothetical protein